MDLEDFFFRMGIPTYCNDVVTNIPQQVTNEIKPIQNIMQSDIGYIYGMSVYADRTDPIGNIMITTTQAQNLYLQLRNGSISFGQYIALDDMLSTYAGSPVIREKKYLPFNIPGTYADHGKGAPGQHFDISQSSYLNPTGIVSAATGPPIVIRLKFWYVPTVGATMLAKHGFFDPDHPRHHPHGHRASAAHPAHTAPIPAHH
jgi:hypothetical protein